MRDVGLDQRLLSVAGFVRQGAVVADIGTDHAHLPIFLLNEGRVRAAYLSDINEGPLKSAEENVRAAGLSNRVTFMLLDGAAGLSGLGITDYCIAGMGGELIADIIAAAPHLRVSGTRLILQPMTRQAHLRSFLAREGFSVLDERYTSDGGKYYLTLLAEYSGTPRELTPAVAECGEVTPRAEDIEAARGYLGAKLRGYAKALEGKRRGGEDTAYESAICLAISARLKNIESE